jgi:glutathione S-transferase
MSAPAVLYHFAFHPGSRTARLALGEARVEFGEELVKPWEDDCPVIDLNPSGMPPVLTVTEKGKTLTLCEIDAILGWIEDRSKGDVLMPADIGERAEARMLREGRDALRTHLAMFEALAAGREWLAGRRLSQADLIAAGHLSVLDYFGEITWASYPALKTWYSKLKSRPCFRPLLTDRFPGVHPATWYADLDF